MRDVSFTPCCSRASLMWFSGVAFVQMLAHMLLLHAQPNVLITLVSQDALFVLGWMILMADNGQRRMRLLWTAPLMTFLVLWPLISWTTVIQAHGKGQWLLGALLDPWYFKVQLLAWPLTWLGLAYHRAWHVEGHWRVSWQAWSSAFWRVLGQKCCLLGAGAVALVAYVWVGQLFASVGWMRLSQGWLSSSTLLNLGFFLNAALLLALQSRDILQDSLQHVARSVAVWLLMVGTAVAWVWLLAWSIAAGWEGALPSHSLAGVVGWVGAYVLIRGFLSEDDGSECQKRWINSGAWALLGLVIIAWLVLGWGMTVSVGPMICQTGLLATGIHAYNYFWVVTLALCTLWLLKHCLGACAPACCAYRRSCSLGLYGLVVYGLLNPVWVQQVASVEAARAVLKPWCHVQPLLHGWHRVSVVTVHASDHGGQSTQTQATKVVASPMPKVESAKTHALEHHEKHAQKEPSKPRVAAQTPVSSGASSVASAGAIQLASKPKQSTGPSASSSKPKFSVSSEGEAKPSSQSHEDKQKA